MRPARSSTWIAWLVVSLALPSIARAQCADERVSTAEGACCYAGQSWDGARCVGPPICPAMLVAEGDTCVPRMVPAVSLEPQRSAPDEAFGAPSWSAGLLDDEVPPVPTGRLTRRHSTVGLGAAMLAGGWTAAAGFSTLYGVTGTGFSPGCRSTHAWWGWLPVIGPVIAPAAVQSCVVSFDSTFTEWTVYSIAAGAQLLGLALVIFGWSDLHPIAPRFSVRGDGVAIEF